MLNKVSLKKVEEMEEDMEGSPKASLKPRAFGSHWCSTLKLLYMEECCQTVTACPFHLQAEMELQASAKSRRIPGTRIALVKWMWVDRDFFQKTLTLLYVWSFYFLVALEKNRLVEANTGTLQMDFLRSVFTPVSLIDYVVFLDDVSFSLFFSKIRPPQTFYQDVLNL